MQEIGIFNPQQSASALGLNNADKIYYNLPPALLYEQALACNEARLSAQGALCAQTGRHTGRSAQDKFIVRDSATEHTVWWENNKPVSPQHFNSLYENFLCFAQKRQLFVQDLVAGAEAENSLRVRIISETAWHSLFIRNLLIRPSEAELRSFTPELVILHMPNFKADPVRHFCHSETLIACDLSAKRVLIGGTSYAGEIKKAVFTVLNYLLPERGILPMHCSANMERAPGAETGKADSALFFGLSGTGKTTLSATADRILIGDDEHGWSKRGIFNFEGGCYAKTIRLSPQAEPEIYAATQRFGSVLENVVLNAKREPDFDDASLTENSRCAYPLEFIANAGASGAGGQPKHIIMLTADAFGVMPPLAKLTPAQAMYHFLSGYTAKIAGTEKGVTEPQATFSACFGAPFMPRRPTEYSALLGKLITEHKVQCWLVNTGWTGGAYGAGKRMPISATRALLKAALEGDLSDENTAWRRDAYFGFAVPETVAGIDKSLLNPESAWGDKQAYAAQAAKLVTMFGKNFAKFAAAAGAEILNAAPQTPAG